MSETKLKDLTCSCICNMYVGSTRRVISWPGPELDAWMRTVALLVFARALSSLGTVHVTVLRQQPTEDGDLSASLPWRWYFWSANPRWWKRLHFIVLYLLD